LPLPFLSFGLLLICGLLSPLLGAAPVEAQDRQDDQRRVAMVIGVSKYRHVAPLPNPTNDSRDVAAALRRLRFDVVEVTDPTISKLKNAQLEFIDRLIDADVAILYYAGHSIQVAGANYLIPVDATLATTNELNSQTYDIARLITRMDKLAKIKIVVLDACRNNPFIRRVDAALQEANDGRKVGRGLAPMSNVRSVGTNATQDVDTYGTIIAYSAAPGQTAADGLGRNSPYTAALLRSLEKPGLEVGRMFRTVAAGVIEQTKGVQKPEYLAKLSNEFYFSRPEPHKCDRLAVADLNQIGLPGVAFDEIKFKAAIPVCKAAVSSVPDNPRFLHNLARAYDAASKYGLAVARYRQAAKLDFVPAINNLGVMYINGHGVKQNFTKGVVLLKQAKKRGNKHARIALQTIDFSKIFESSEFKKLQTKLSDQGFFNGVRNGKFNDATKKGLREYQRKYRLARKGLTLETLDALKLLHIIPNYETN